MLGFLIAGSPSFGLEALLLGLGGNFTVRFGKKLEALKFALPIGLIIVGVTLGIGLYLRLEPLYLTVLTLGITYLAGGITSFINRFERDEGGFEKEDSVTNEEIEEMLEERGFSNLIGRENSSDEEPQSKKKG